MMESSPGTAPPPPPDEVVLKFTRTDLRRLLAMFRRLLGWATLAYGVALFLGMFALEYWGEYLSVLSLLLYAPPYILLAPLLLLTPLCLLFRWRLCLWHGVFVLAVAFGYMTFGVSGSSRKTDAMISAVTFNHGEGNSAEFAEFIAAENPDFILLQDARNRGPVYANKYPGTYVAAHGEFVLVSRYPVRKSNLLEEPKWMGKPVAARFEVMVKDQPVVFYSVHLPTPRQELTRFLGLRRVMGDLIGWKSREAGFGNYREWLLQRVELARALDQIFRDEKLPFIVAGDFNTADHGHIYHLFADEMTDAFDAAGSGWGMTFPGNTKRRFVGPWLRLDYFFAGRDWKPVVCRPSDGTKSQHKPVFARFEPAK